MSKPTAFIDIALFGLLLVALRIDVLVSLGLGIMAVGAMGILQINNAKDIMNTHLGKRVFAIGVIIFIVALGKLLWQNYRKVREEKQHYVKYIGIWLIALLAVLVVFK